MRSLFPRPLRSQSAQPPAPDDPTPLKARPPPTATGGGVGLTRHAAVPPAGMNGHCRGENVLFSVDSGQWLGKDGRAHLVGMPACLHSAAG